MNQSIAALSALLIMGVSGMGFAETSATVEVSADKPNIIFIMADDLGFETLGCYGNKVNKTPNLDKLAKQGMQFSQAYSTPLCTPTRVQVMTGKYNHRNYVTFGLLDKKEKTFGTYLKDAGYATGIAGKWQLLGNAEARERAGGRVGSWPHEVGFDEYCMWQVDQLGSRYKDPTITTTTGTETREGDYGPDVYNDFVLGFIRKHQDRPFFLYYPMALTHSPYQPTPDTPGYESLPLKGSEKSKYFKDNVEYMDKLVGKVMDEVTSLGLSKKTIVIFTGDNGTGREVTSVINGESIQGGKSSTTKYGTMVPLIMRWESKIKAGSRNDNLVDFTDFLPTFLQAANVKVPDDAALDGMSLLGQLLGKDSAVRQWVFCYYFPQLRSDYKAIWANNKQYKLYSDGRFFDVEKDPLELNVLPEAELNADAKEARSMLDGVIKKQLDGRHEEVSPPRKPKEPATETKAKGAGKGKRKGKQAADDGEE